MDTNESNTKKNGKKFRNNKKGNQQKKKFVPQFKKKLPTWKLVDTETKELLPKYEQIDPSKIEQFSDFPLSKRTLDGLAKSNYVKPTEIQRESIGIALRGYDLLGAAKTGSGKTLAFLIPILECLFHAKWTKLDGLGVLVISPTRELAYQTFEVLKKIGKFHDFSAGLVIGGKDLKTESKIINQTNIIICTPGRLLQHMDETYNFNCDNLKILVLDEADRILDLGFAETMNAIVENLPTSRQTLLFSATQTKSVKDLARLSLKNPTYVSVHEHSAISTPKNLIQNYVVCETHDKISFLWSFIRNHLNQKIIVFFQSCKQVKFVYEAFTKMHTGMTTLALYGTMNQLRRMNVYDQYCRKQSAILFATDIAARGLDFPSINWVIQMDCPPDCNTYIHRVGRTARYEKDGQAILILTPSEEAEMLNELKLKKIPVSKIEVNMKKIVNIDSKLQSLCAGDVELKESAKRALMAYMRSIFLMSNKKIFNIENIDTVKFSSSLGLVVAPRIRFLQNAGKNKNVSKSDKRNDSNDDDQEETEDSGDEEQTEKSQDESDSEEERDSKPRTEAQKTATANALIKKTEVKIQNTKKKIIRRILPQDNNKPKDEPLNFSEITNSRNEEEDDDDNNDSLFTVKSVFNPKLHKNETNNDSEDLDLNQNKKIKIKTKASIAKKLKKMKIKVNEKVQFDDEGNRILTSINQPRSVNITDMLAEELNKKDDDLKDEKKHSGIDIEEARERLRNEDQYDKQIYRERIKRLHKEKKQKEKEFRRSKRRRGEEDAEVGLANDEEDDENSSFVGARLKNDYNESDESD